MCLNWREESRAISLLAVVQCLKPLSEDEGGGRFSLVGVIVFSCLQCFDPVGWLTGRAFSL